MKFRREVVAGFAAVALAACSAAAAGSPDTSEPGSVPATVAGVGVLPAPLGSSADDSVATEDSPLPTDENVDGTEVDEADAPDSSETSTTRPRATTTTVVESKTLGEQVTGNRVLMIGDSILASTSRRYGNNMCKNLVPLGWVVSVEAEVSRDITFGNTVLRSVLDNGWDAAVILLGNNYGEKPNAYLSELNKMLVALSPRPVLLLTVTEDESSKREVNDIIRSVAALYPNVTVVDWATIGQEPGVISGDGLHLTDDGREFLAQALVPYFGTAPVQPGDCLASRFHDDSEGLPNNKPSTTVKPGNKPPSTTVKPTSTTIRPGSSTTTTKPPTTNAPTTTTPYDVDPPSTVTTLPPQTVPPQTQATSPPTQPTPPPVTLPPVVSTNPPGPPGTA
jgi:hypothetical protein